MSGERARAAPPGRPRPDPVAARAEARERHAAVTEPGPVMDAAARFLEARSRSVAETRRRLVGAGYPRDLVETVLARLGDLGYLDDDAFARAWVESRDRAHPRGEAALRRELAQKGVPAEIVAAVLEARRGAVTEAAGAARIETGTGDAGRGAGIAAGLVDGGPDDAAARRALERRASVLRREPDPRKRRARAYALLARQGFDPDTCRIAVLAWMAGSGQDEERS